MIVTKKAWGILNNNTGNITQTDVPSSNGYNYLSDYNIFLTKDDAINAHEMGLAKGLPNHVEIIEVTLTYDDGREEL